MRLLRFLNRLRLRLGLFFWENYGVVYEVFPGGPWAARLHNCRDDAFVVSWKLAIRHIRRCVRRGVRP